MRPALPLLHFSFSVVYFFSWASSASAAGGAVRPVAATNQDLSLSHVMRWGDASVKRASLEISVTAVAVVTMVSFPMAAQVVKQMVSQSGWLVIFLTSDWLIHFPPSMHL